MVLLLGSCTAWNDPVYHLSFRTPVNWITNVTLQPERMISAALADFALHPLAAPHFHASQPNHVGRMFGEGDVGAEHRRPRLRVAR
jgi:hypothetical protein